MTDQPMPENVPDGRLSHYNVEELRRVASGDMPAEHCGHLPPQLLTNRHPGLDDECALRPGHSGSHAASNGMRWRRAAPDNRARGRHIAEAHGAPVSSGRACRYCPDPSCPEDCPECGGPIHDLDAVPPASDPADATPPAEEPPVQCWHTEAGTPCDWDVCKQPERLTVGDYGTDPKEQPGCTATLNHPDHGSVRCDEDHGDWATPTYHAGPIPTAEGPALRYAWHDQTPGATPHTDQYPNASTAAAEEN